MNQVSKTGLAEVAAGEAAARELAALMEEFIMVVREENAMLARGLPASLSAVSERKHELAGAFERWVKAASSRTVRLETAPAPARKLFLERLQLFQTTMNENVARLEAAIEASRRRIDAVMSAIRQEMVDVTPYGSNGKLRTVANRSAIRPGFSI